MPAGDATPVRTFEGSRRWADDGTQLFLSTTQDLTDQALDDPSGLPDWSRRHVVSHVAANADALGNLVAWAASGRRTPMYASAQARVEGIERGQHMSAGELLRWLRDSSIRLQAAMNRLTTSQWAAQVVTAQGRTVSATEIPWLRAREVFVHSVDLALGVGFVDLPSDFLDALLSDVVAKRGDVPDVDGALSERVAWLTGRPHRLVGVTGLGPWL